MDAPVLVETAPLIVEKSGPEVMVGAAEFEPGTPSPPDWCANRAALRSAGPWPMLYAARFCRARAGAGSTATWFDRARTTPPGKQSLTRRTFRGHSVRSFQGGLNAGAAVISPQKGTLNI